VSEAWSTKTCSMCGHLNDVGASREYHCAHCGLTADRDAQATKNILAYNLSLLLTLRPELRHALEAESAVLLSRASDSAVANAGPGPRVPHPLQQD
jgi:transposase